MNGFSKGILLLNTGSGPAFIIEQAFKLNMDRDLMRTGVLIGLCLYRPFRGASPLPQVPHQTRDWGLLWERACPAKGTAKTVDSLGQFLSWQSSCRFAWVMLLSAGTLRVSHTLPPMVEPLPMVMRPRIVAPA